MKVQVVALSHYKHQKEKFMEEVTPLQYHRKQFIVSKNYTGSYKFCFVSFLCTSEYLMGCIMQVGQLRQRFPSYISQGGLANSDRIPASAFSHSAQDIWNEIKQNRDLDLPNHKVC